MTPPLFFAQETEVGDGTNLVVVLAGELLELAEELLKNGLHISEVISGYKVASAKAIEHLDTLVTKTADASVFADARALAQCIESVIASKQWGNETLFAAKIAEACKMAMPTNPANFNIDNVRVAKIIGNAVDATTVVRGLCLPRNVAGTIKEVFGAKIAVYGVPLDAATTETKGTVLLKNAEELKKYNDSEEDSLEAAIKAIADTGANVIVCAQTIGELALHFVEKYKLMVLKVPSKFELRRLCRSTGATTLVRLEPPKSDELGSCAHVHVREIGSTR